MHFKMTESNWQFPLDGCHPNVKMNCTLEKDIELATCPICRGWVDIGIDIFDILLKTWDSPIIFIKMAWIARSVTSIYLLDRIAHFLVSCKRKFLKESSVLVRKLMQVEIQISISWGRVWNFLQVRHFGGEFNHTILNSQEKKTWLSAIHHKTWNDTKNINHSCYICSQKFTG